MLRGLQAGKSAAKESDPVRPIADAHLDQVIQAAPPPIAAALLLMRTTGARGGEILAMRQGDVDRTTDPWVYRPRSHKTAHLGAERVIFIGRRGQEVLGPMLNSLDPDRYVFRPSEVMQWHRDQRRAKRKTPLSYGNGPGTHQRKNPAKVPGERYDSTAFHQAVARACDVAFPLPARLDRQQLPKANGRGNRTETIAEWKRRLTPAQQAEVKAWRQQHRIHPHQIRHTRATELRATHGLEAAAATLGHRSLSATQIYAERDTAAARKIAQAHG
jgi:integrase